MKTDKIFTAYVGAAALLVGSLTANPLSAGVGIALLSDAANSL